MNESLRYINQKKKKKANSCQKTVPEVGPCPTTRNRFWAFGRYMAPTLTNTNSFKKHTNRN